MAFQDGGSAVSSGAGTAGSGWREPNGTEFCALNLQPHPSLGATFATTMTWRPETLVGENLTAATFEVIRTRGRLPSAPGASASYVPATSYLSPRPPPHPVLGVRVGEPCGLSLRPLDLLLVF